MNLKNKLKELGLALPDPPAAVANYQAVKQWDASGLLIVSGQLPIGEGGKLVAQGPVPSQTSLEEAKDAAGVCILRALAALDQHLGGQWTDVQQVLRVGVFVASDNDFIEQHRVADGASNLLISVLGEAIGKHARAAVGVTALPLGASVEVELMLAVKAPRPERNVD